MQGSEGAAPEWMTLLGKSEKGGRSEEPRVEGDVPAALRGVLYRNGPGLFERGGHRVANLLDGDGLVQRLSFSEFGVHYRNAFVQTDKLKREAAAGTRLHATWSARRPGPFWRNVGGGITQSQAGVTVYPVNGKLIARDELGPNFEIDPDTLETLGTFPIGEGVGNVAFKAHSKLDPETGEWLLAGQQFGPKMTLHGVVYEADFTLKAQFAFPVPRQVYIHDFFASKAHLIFVLHPCMVSPLGFLAGFKSLIDSLAWRGAKGNLIAVVPRTGGEPRFFEAPGAFMWHALNAFEDGDALIADFVGYDEPDHFIGANALFRNIMDGRLGKARQPGTIRRYAIDLNKRRLREEIVDTGNHEFPMLDERCAMGRHRIGYFAHGGLGAFNSGVKRLDYETGAVEAFDFGAETQVGEPVFAARPGGATDDGWLIVQCLDGASKTTFFALFDAATVGKGPVAKLWLSHHAPISFHGAWQAP